MKHRKTANTLRTQKLESPSSHGFSSNNVFMEKSVNGCVISVTLNRRLGSQETRHALISSKEDTQCNPHSGRLPLLSPGLCRTSTEGKSRSFAPLTILSCLVCTRGCCEVNSTARTLSYLLFDAGNIRFI
ncbi:hypothetical protein AVEN_133475-1 [Araneus ventricosus]|uniref:Uncharacterized protein n=1 Tax=Araneus ventricosus TaxID=182803 RepID=A0A4Y2KCJ3_ARAVE|nr:hypothetical protein AVEN_133475-1 [Araneus ventricosus]